MSNRMSKGTDYTTVANRIDGGTSGLKRVVRGNKAIANTFAIGGRIHVVGLGSLYRYIYLVPTY